MPFDIAHTQESIVDIYVLLYAVHFFLEIICFHLNLNFAAQQ